MKRSLFTQQLKQSLLAVSASSLMLGATHAGTVALNLNSFYYNTDGQNWASYGGTPGPIGSGYGYQTAGWIVTSPAFGVSPANWSAPLIFAWWSPTSVDVTQPMGGSISAHLTAPAAIETGIGEQNDGFNAHPGLAETVAPGNDEVTWNILQSNGGVSPAVSLSGLAASYPNGYVVQTITAARGLGKAFNGVQFTDGINTTHSDYNITYYKASPASNPDVAGGTIGLSDPSGTFTSDTLQINCDPETTGSNSVLCGFIITDVPVLTRNVPADILLATGGAFILPPPSIIGVGLTYQWQHAGTNLPGATFSTYTNSSAAGTDSGTYQAVVTSTYFPSTSVTGLVANVNVIPTHAARTATWDADTATTGAQDGAGTWSNTLTNWWSGSIDDYWGSADSAVLGASGSGAYTVTLGDNITANSITFNSGTYTITNSSGQTLTLQGSPALSGTANGTITVQVTITTNTLIKTGAGSITLAGALTCTNVFVGAGSLEVQAKTGGDSTYVVTNGATLKIGYSTGGGYANTGLQLYGDGTAATTGLYLKGGTSYNVNNGVVVNGAPTTIRQYGSGLAAFGIFDYNSNPGLSITVAASGSVLDSNIQMVSRGYGMVVTTAAGANTAAGDLTVNGSLNVAGSGLFKRGTGSLRLNGAALAGNGGLNVQAGTVICGTAGCIGANASLKVSAGATLDLNGTSQTVTNAPTLAGTLKMSINKGGLPASTILEVTDGGLLTYGGNLVVTNIGGTIQLGDTFYLFTNSAGNFYYIGSFTSITLPPLPNGLAWQTDSLLLDGSIQVIVGSTPPTIVSDLSGTTNYAYAGGNATFAITASGDPILHYQWKKNGTTVVGTDSPTLSLTALTLGSAGYYSCTVTNNFSPAARSQTNYLLVVTPSLAVGTMVQDTPTSLWPLSETIPTTAYDYWSGNNGTQNGSLTLGAPGPMPPTYAGFSPGTAAYQFDGASAYLSLGTNVSLSGTTDFTLEAWINTTNTANGMILQQRYTGTGYIGEYEFQVNGNGTLYFMIYGSGGYQFNFSSPVAARRVNDGKWHHVAAVRSGSNGYLYIDGSLVGSASGALQSLTPTIPTAIGVDLRDNVSFFNGSMCDVAIYNTALPAARIANHAYTGVLAANPLVLSIVPGGWTQDSKPVGTPHVGEKLGASWLASNTDLNSVTRTGVAQFSSGAQIAVPANPDFNSPTGTICFWMQTPLPLAGHGAMLVDHRITAGMVITIDGTPTGGLGIQYTGNPSFSTGGYVVDGNWHQVTITYDQSASGSVSAYVDGGLVGSQANTAAWSWPTNQQIELGRSHDTYWQEYNGLMDDFRIYNSMLQPADIATIATPATSDTLVNTSALMVRYNFGTAAGVGQALSWPLIGVLQSSPALGTSGVWTPVNTTTAAYPFLPPSLATTNSVLFYQLQQ